MIEITLKALRNAAASSVIERMPMEQRYFEAIKQIKDGIMTLQQCFQSLKTSSKKGQNMAYSIDAILDGCYPDSAVLINKLDIRDKAGLTDAETVGILRCSSEIEENPQAELLTFNSIVICTTHCLGKSLTGRENYAQ